MSRFSSKVMITSGMYPFAFQISNDNTQKYWEGSVLSLSSHEKYGIWYILGMRNASTAFYLCLLKSGSWLCPERSSWPLPIAEVVHREAEADRQGHSLRGVSVKKKKRRELFARGRRGGIGSQVGSTLLLLLQRRPRWRPYTSSDCDRRHCSCSAPLGQR